MADRLPALSGTQLSQLHQALLKAFPSVDLLREMVAFQLNENLDALVPTAALRSAAFELVVWARSRGHLERLLEGALAHNPGNPELRAFATSVGFPVPAAPETPPPPPPPLPPPPPPLDDATLARELRGVMAKLYSSTVDARRLCAEAEIARERVDFSGASQVVWFNVIEEATRSGRLVALLKTALTEYPRNVDLLRLASRSTPSALLDPAEVTEEALLDALLALLPSQMEEVIFRMNAPTAYLPATTQGERAIALVRFATSQRRARDLRTVIDRVAPRRR